MLGKRPASTGETATSATKKLSVPATQSQSDQSRPVEQSFSQSTGTSYDQRTGSGQIMASYAPRDSAQTVDSLTAGAATVIKRPCQIDYNEEDFVNITQPYRFMFTSLDERALALERHLLHLQKKMCSAFNIPEDNLQPVGTPSQDFVWCCGRICCDNAEGRINKESVVLEGSRKDSGGRRVTLDFKELTTAFSIFPGQIVLVEGINSSGRTMVVKRLIDGVDPVHRIKSGEISSSLKRNENLHVMVASGPFTTTENLEYEPLKDFLGLALSKKPDVIILCGPFVDIANPILNNGNFSIEEEGTSYSASFELVFVRKVIHECIASFYASEEEETLHTQIILIPSLQDAHHEFVFPQPPFGDRNVLAPTFVVGDIEISKSLSKDKGKKVHFLSNPCMFSVNGVVFGASTNDALFALSSDEASQQLGGNRLPFLASHLIRQNSFCPQFPIPTSVTGQVRYLLFSFLFLVRFLVFLWIYVMFCTLFTVGFSTISLLRNELYAGRSSASF